MSRAGSTTLCHLGWRDNRDGFDVALAVNRLLRHGAAAWWLTAPQAAAEAGDYVVALDAHQRRALARLEIRVGDWSGAVPSGARPLVSPSVCLFAGTASRFPYFAYYALAPKKDMGAFFHNNGIAVFVCVYIPALVLILRRPNEGRLPEFLERIAGVLPRWLRGRPALAA